MYCNAVFTKRYSDMHIKVEEIWEFKDFRTKPSLVAIYRIKIKSLCEKKLMSFSLTYLKCLLNVWEWYWWQFYLKTTYKRLPFLFTKYFVYDFIKPKKKTLWVPPSGSRKRHINVVPLNQKGYKKNLPLFSTVLKRFYLCNYQTIECICFVLKSALLLH